MCIDGVYLSLIWLNVKSPTVKELWEEGPDLELVTKTYLPSQMLPEVQKGEQGRWLEY